MEEAYELTHTASNENIGQLMCEVQAHHRHAVLTARLERVTEHAQQAVLGDDSVALNAIANELRMTTTDEGGR